MFVVLQLCTAPSCTSYQTFVDFPSHAGAQADASLNFPATSSPEARESEDRPVAFQVERGLARMGHSCRQPGTLHYAFCPLRGQWSEANPICSMALAMAMGIFQTKGWSSADNDRGKLCSTFASSSLPITLFDDARLEAGHSTVRLTSRYCR